MKIPLAQVVVLSLASEHNLNFFGLPFPTLFIKSVALSSMLFKITALVNHSNELGGKKVGRIHSIEK